MKQLLAKNILLKNIFFIILLCIGKTCFADIIITGQTVIDKPTVYENVTLDLSNGSFLITNNATLKLKNTVVNGTLSPNNPNLIYLAQGKLILHNNRFNITTNNLQPTPSLISLYSSIKVSQGIVEIKENKFSIDKPYMAALFYTDATGTSDFKITNNIIRNFHGGIYLTNSKNAFIAYNHFFNTSFSNITTILGENNVFQQNTMLFSGNNGITIIDSSGTVVRENIISGCSCYGLCILRAQDLLIDHNIITAGITYAIIILSSYALGDIPILDIPYLHNPNLMKMMSATHHKTKIYNEDITITNNYIAQNRYGITVNGVEGLSVQNNLFIQKFSNASDRKFWTNNDILLMNITENTWDNNFYKEAFTQSISEDNSAALKFVIFPQHGGVVLS